MRIIPAIDIINGQCVRLVQGDYAQKTIYSLNPFDVAKAFEDKGFTDLHLVDLDGAKSGGIVNLGVLKEITSGCSLRVDFGGGIKTKSDLIQAFESGAKQVTVGSLAVTRPEIVKSWLNNFGADKIILGADVDNGMLAINGWKERTNVELFSFIDAYRKAGVTKVICTDIATDGMLSGPSIELYTMLLTEFPDLDLIASGGVSSMKDIEQLRAIGLEGVIIGKALYENKIEIKELVNYVS